MATLTFGLNTPYDHPKGLEETSWSVYNWGMVVATTCGIEYSGISTHYAWVTKQGAYKLPDRDYK
jgi:hypothetical protein